jgi:phosphate acetyltransferase
MNDYYGFLAQLIALKDCLPPLKTAIVHPVDANSLCGAIEAAAQGIIEPIFVGSKDKIQAVADKEGVDLSSYRIEAVAHSHAAAARAVELVHEGEVESIMKGKIHTDEFMEPIITRVGGLRTARRMSHVFAMKVPTYPKLLFLSDAALNIRPTLSEKRDIVQNAIDLYSVMGLGKPNVAILSAVETVTERLPSTLDAAALCKMADRGQITGGVLDGPLALDNAISIEAARAKGIESPVAGNADILIVPDVESGNMLYKQMTYLLGVEAAGVVIGAKVPIILTSRAADKGITRSASCALALLYARKQQNDLLKALAS